MTRAKKFICSLLLLIAGTAPSFAQYSQQIDSLKKLLVVPQSDTLRVFRLNELARLYNMISPDSSVLISNQAIELATKVNYIRGLARAHVNKGIAFDNLGMLEESLNEYLIARKIVLPTGFKREIASTFTNAGIIYVELGKFDSALKSYEMALQYKDSTIERDLESIGIVYTNMGVAYSDLGDAGKALEYFLKSTSIAKRIGDKQGIADNNLNVTDIYTSQGQYQKALDLLGETLQLQDELGDKEGFCYSKEAMGNNYWKSGNFQKGQAYLNEALDLANEMKLLLRIGAIQQSLGDCYAAQKEYGNALFHYQKSLEANTELGDVKALVNNHIALGNMDLVMSHVDSSLKEFTISAQMAEQAHYLAGLKESYEGLANAYEKKGNFKNAYAFYVKRSAINDSLRNEKENLHLMRLQVEFETENKDQQIALLNTKTKLQETENRKQLLLRNAFIFGFIAALIFVTLLFTSIRRTQKTNALLQEKNEIIEQQNKQVEKALRELQQSESQLVQAEKMASLGQLTAGVAHEINNPINFVSGNINPLKKNIHEIISELKREKKNQDSPELTLLINETQQLLNGIEEGSRRTAEIVRGLRSFSRADEGSSKLADIHEGLDSSLLILNNKLNYLHIEVVKSYRNLPLVNCFPGQLNQVWMNLLTNAIDAIAQDGKIFVTTDTIASDNGISSVRISIRDTGRGISEEVMKKIFDPFFTTKEVGKGTGLGLAISYGIIEKHKGKIDVISEVGKGTEFIVTLPVA